ncbi:hypothetical protein [Myxococcus eversor]|uniref:hypothetical protein n=1 Tax=Myxococcus eversor TaxID=2709661 RepID=UPI0013D6DA0E|nr:hypothetical protein [Myxococcus eversor]
MRLRELWWVGLAVLGVLACQDSGLDPGAAPGDDLGVSEAKATATRIYATEASLELSFETMGTFETRNGVRSLILHATANRYLEHVFSFIPDDGFGTANIISERRFEVVLPDGPELHEILSGRPLFIAIDTFTGTPTSYTAKIEVYPRFFDFRGASALVIDEEVDPVYVKNAEGNVVFRGRVDVAADALAVTAADGIPSVSRMDADTFRLDWTYSAVRPAMDPHTVPLVFDASLTGGTTARKTARLVARVTSLELTTGDAYEVWPTPGCYPGPEDCLNALPEEATDLSACGSYREVLHCLDARRACQGVPREPLVLRPVDSLPLEPARAVWNAGSNSGTWHYLEPIESYITPRCPTERVTIQGVLAKLAGAHPGMPAVEAGVLTDRAGLGQSVFLSQTSYGDGRVLLAALDSAATAGEVQAWVATSEEPCQNCHQFAHWTVLYYPFRNLVVVLRGHTGYDS